MKTFLFILNMACTTFFSRGQYDPAALQVLDAMSTHYKKVNAFNADFTQKLTNKTAGLNETIPGNITVKGNKFLLEISGRKIFRNNKDIYTFNEELNEVTIATYDPEESEISLVNIYDVYKTGFKYILISTMGNGDRIVDLNPESGDKSYFKIRMVITRKDELKSFSVFEKSGNVYKYSIDSFKKVNVTNAFFTFDPSEYKGVEILDFR